MITDVAIRSKPGWKDVKCLMPTKSGWVIRFELKHVTTHLLRNKLFRRLPGNVLFQLRRDYGLLSFQGEQVYAFFEVDQSEVEFLNPIEGLAISGQPPVFRHQNKREAVRWDKRKPFRNDD